MADKHVKNAQNHYSLGKYKLEPQWDTIIHALVWIKWKRLTMRSFGKNMKQFAVSCTSSGNVQLYNNFRNQFDSFLKF